MTQTTVPDRAEPEATLASLPATRKLLLLLFNAIPLLHVSTAIACGLLLKATPWLAFAATLAVIYLLPPIVCRCVLLAMPIRRQVVSPGSREFFVWWFTLNLQMLFCRLPFLDELLRLVPGLYSLWLRLWGAKIGKLTYWAAGLRILDRPFLKIGDHVTFGAGVRLNPHVILPGADGSLVLALAPVCVGDRANVGGYSLLVAGSEIAAGECTRACLMLPPFYRLEGGRRQKPASFPSGLEAARLGTDAV